MCGRYFVGPTVSELKAAICEAEKKLHAQYARMSIKTGEVFPTDIVAVRTKKSGFMPMKWGFTMGEKGRVVINARIEDAAQKQFFGHGKHRCVVPAGYYYEWEKTPDGKIRRALGPVGSDAVYFAGLCKMEKDEDIARFVILTRPAAAGIAHIHDRMPVILRKEACDAWLDDYDAARRAVDADVLPDVLADD